MFRQDKISIAITFVIGLIAGSYLYLTGFATTFELPEVDNNDIYSGLVITTDFYGVCDVNGLCISFQILEDGSFRAVFENEDETNIQEGRIPRDLRRELDQSLTNSVLQDFSTTLNFPECYFDNSNENNYTFNITIDGVNYDLDTCETAINYDSPAWIALAKLINYFINLN